MRIAAIDVGSNSLHMVIVEADRRGSFQVLDRERDMVRLGAGALSRGRLPASIMRSGLSVLRRYKKLAQIHRVDKIIAVATSAVRSASNGDDFLERVGRETGIWPKVIPGEEEARLVYLAAQHSVHLEGKRALVMDLGGGSFEMALGTGRKIERVFTERLGVLRVSEKFVRTDPISPKDERRLADRVRRRLSPFSSAIGPGALDVVVGCSGTILTLGAMASEMESGEAPDSLHHRTVQAATIRALRKKIVAADLRGRLHMPGMDNARADLIVAGAIVLDTTLDQLGVSQLTLCEWALREGVLLDYIQGHPQTLARAVDYPDIRRRSVVALTERWRHDTPHSRHVAALALQLFDGIRPLHGLAEGDRALLEYAALLHGVGHHISNRRHDRHAEYLIRNGDLRGFEPEEIDMLAGAARFHKRGRLSRSRPDIVRLSKPLRRRLRRLAGLLRLADALDRSHKQLVASIACRARQGNLRVVCSSAGPIELELWGAERRKRLLEKTLGMSVSVSRSAAKARGGARPSQAAGPAGNSEGAVPRLRSVSGRK